ncbi:outer membrane beta-barrel protein [Hymenobacter jeollabukensis]|uniref:PorT family protein n=1 Tax=Hymenobacter jeollabukensis TaxID=2025313 RepID=A0A5R8WM66_9BACT|nr:outer membrane beta-barrel protein [Hymenobacter jeollabukensis]TLM90414.1 PorT family protein [Hymenobacter jeollabukensis]
MTPVSNNNNDHRPPTGNLEELFRQKMAEAELTPRADVWDRLDHELLLRENQGYRRRLVGYRRAAAAAVAVATLGLGGWLTQRTLAPAPGTEIAVVDSNAAARSAAARLGQAAQPSAEAAARGAATASTAASSTRSGFSDEQASAADASAASSGAATQSEAGLLASTDAATTAASATTSNPVENLRESFGARRSAASRADQPSLLNRAVAAIRQTFGGAASPAVRGGSLMPANPVLAPRGNASATLVAGVAPTGARSAAVAPSATGGTELEYMSAIASRLRRANLSANVPDSLKPALLSTPALLAAQATAAQEQDDKKASASSHWRWRGSFGAQRFAPNVSSVVGSGMAFSAMPTPTTVAQRAPVPEEPTRLQPGLAQRGMFGVAVPLSKKHWTLLTGAEVAVMSGRTGREVPQTLLNNNAADEKFQTGRYQLTTVGVPMQVRYESHKQGWGVYAAVGAAVNVLLRNRTAVGTQATTDDSSYRRVLATTRGSAGVRFSPASGNWQLNLGPEAEAGLNTLNANPSEKWSQRTRPYALGLSASMEFGGGKAELAP